MELFFNFMWVVVSLLLFVHWTRTAKPTSARQVTKATVAFLLLIVVLLPVISATDDLVSMAGMLEGEHSEHPEHLVRRGEVLLDHSAAPPILAIFAILFVDLAFLSTLLTRVLSRSKAVKLMDSFVLVAGIRPPPSASITA